MPQPPNKMGWQILAFKFLTKHLAGKDMRFTEIKKMGFSWIAIEELLPP